MSTYHCKPTFAIPCTILTEWLNPHLSFQQECQTSLTLLCLFHLSAKSLSQPLTGPQAFLQGRNSPKKINIGDPKGKEYLLRFIPFHITNSLGPGDSPLKWSCCFHIKGNRLQGDPITIGRRWDLNLGFFFFFNPGFLTHSSKWGK